MLMYCLFKLSGQNDMIIVMLFRLAIILYDPFTMASGELGEKINNMFYGDWCSQDTSLKL